MRILESPLLATFPHGFTTRDGGVSDPPYDRLNLGGFVGDDPGRVAENWRRLEQATGLAFARVRQVHGARVVRADAAGPPVEDADAIVSARAGVAACVSVADCVPVLLADPVSGAVAAVHAGWRGTLARAAAEGVAALAREVGASPAHLLAAIGPSIGPCCYEVSEDLAARFEAELGSAALAPGPRPRLDLWRANTRVLALAGVDADRVAVLGRCTSCERDLFFSHRRDAGRTGRQMAFIAPRAPTRS
jgi:purine-nucleoside/S-methyl-5'-thioadenosine phosphorylase / adenosine deaminase